MRRAVWLGASARRGSGFMEGLPKGVLEIAGLLGAGPELRGQPSSGILAEDRSNER